MNCHSIEWQNLFRFLESPFLYSTGSHLFIHVPLVRGDQHHLFRQSLLNFRSAEFVKQSALDFHRFGIENCLGGSPYICVVASLHCSTAANVNICFFSLFRFCTFIFLFLHFALLKGSPYAAAARWADATRNNHPVKPPRAVVTLAD